MNPLFDVVQDSAGNVLAGKVLTVKVRATGAPAVIYSDEAGTSVIPGGVVTADEHGRIEFWSPGGTYSIHDGATKVGDNFIPSNSGNTATSKADLAAQAAAGSIPSSIKRIASGCWSAAGDGGAANYARVTSTALNAYALSSTTKALVAFADASGDWWLLDERAPTLNMIGCIGQTLGVVPSLTSADDCAPAITALVEYLSKVYKGGVVGYGNRNYYLHTEPEFLAGVGISGPPVLAREARALDELETVHGIHYVPGLILGPGVTLRVAEGFTAPVLCYKSSDIIVHTTLEGALDMQLALRGTGLTRKNGSTGRNITIGQLVCHGFAFGVDANNMHGLRIGDIYGDCITLAMARNSGETVTIGEGGLMKRKPALTVNDAIVAQTVVVTGLFNSGGYVGVTVDEDVVALGLVTNARCGNSGLPPAIVNQRFTVTILSATTVRLEGAVWDSGYSSWVLNDRSSISFQPQCSSSITAFYDAGGKIGVRCSLPFPFKVGHYALLGANDLAVSGMHTVLTVVSTTDFVLNKSWDAALLSTNLAKCEFGAMPNARYHSSVISYWGTNEGYGGAAVNCDGIRVNFANKGGSGFFCDAASAHISGSNEGPQQGELDYGPTDTTGLKITQPRVRFTGDFKSTGLAIDIDLESASDVVYGYGIQATDRGRASLRVRNGRAVLTSFVTKGLGRILLDNIAGLTILDGNVLPSQLAGNAASDIRKTTLNWRVGDVVHHISATDSAWAWDAAGAAVNIASTSSSSAAYLVPLSAPRKVFTATGALAGGGAASLTATDNGCEVRITTNLGAILLDATTVSDGFRFVVRNYRPGGDWTIPTTGWGSGVVLRFNLAATHTLLKASGEATFTVEDIGATRYLTVRGDTA